METPNIPEPYNSWKEVIREIEPILNAPRTDKYTKVFFHRQPNPDYFGPRPICEMDLFDILLLAAKEPPSEIFTMAELEIIIHVLRTYINEHYILTHAPYRERLQPLMHKINEIIYNRKHRGLKY